MLTHGPSYGGLQEIGMLTLIEEPVDGGENPRNFITSLDRLPYGMRSYLKESSRRPRRSWGRNWHDPSGHCTRFTGLQ
jgi:hypothetical protein